MSAMFASLLFDHAGFAAIGALLPCRPFLHRHKRQQTREAEEQIEHRPRRLSFRVEVVTPAQPETCQGAYHAHAKTKPEGWPVNAGLAWRTAYPRVD